MGPIWKSSAAHALVPKTCEYPPPPPPPPPVTNPVNVKLTFLRVQNWAHLISYDRNKCCYTYDTIPTCKRNILQIWI